MALPAADGFAGTGALSASWTNAINSLTRVGGIAEVGAEDVDCLAFWNADSFTGDQTASIVIGGVLTAGAIFLGPAVRCDAASGGNGYVFVTDGSSGATHSEFGKFINGVYTALKTVTVTFAVGDTVTLDVSGSTLTLKKNGATIDTVATGGQLTGGAAGMYAFHSTGASAGGNDSWGGDNLAGAAAPTPYISDLVITYKV